MPAGGGDQPAPAVGCIWMARAHRRPAQSLFEETEGVLHGETTQVPVPETAQICGERPADPGQPQWVGWQLFVGQAFDLNADHAEVRIGCTADMQVGPGVDRDRAIGRVVELPRELWRTMGAGLSQPKRLTMQARSAAAWAPFGSPVHDATFDQAHQQVSVHFGHGQPRQVVAAVQRHDRTRRVGSLSVAHGGDLLERDLGGRLGRRSAAVHLQRQHPAASRIRNRCQPLVRPGWHDSALRPTWQRAIFPGAVSAGARRWTWPVGAVDDPHRATCDDGIVRQCACEQRPHRPDIDEAVRQRIARARPLTTERRGQTESH